MATTPVVVQAMPFILEPHKITTKTFQDLCKPKWDNLEIFTPEEISKYWTYVSTPCFPHNGQAHFIKTWMLKYKMSESHIVDMWYNSQWKTMIQEGVKRDVDILKLTHVYCIAFFSQCYIIDPYDFGKYYCAFVRGAFVR